jgi:hypothetical protein
MGANAQTSVPTFVASQVLTAQQLNDSARSGVPVFADTTARDAAFGGSGEKVLAEGQLCYLEDTNKVQYYDGAAWANLGSMTNVEAFTASGTFTPPAGVTYAIAHIRAGGGGVGTASAGAGGNSSVAFAAGTITATGGTARNFPMSAQYSFAAPANSGAGADANGYETSGGANDAFGRGADGGAMRGTEIVAGGAVTPGTGITVTVGAGGVAGTLGKAGGSGYVWIEYQV